MMCDSGSGDGMGEGNIKYTYIKELTRQELCTYSLEPSSVKMDTGQS